MVEALRSLRGVFIMFERCTDNGDTVILFMVAVIGPSVCVKALIFEVYVRACTAIVTFFEVRVFDELRRIGS